MIWNTETIKIKKAELESSHCQDLYKMSQSGSTLQERRQAKETLLEKIGKDTSPIYRESRRN